MELRRRKHESPHDGEGGDNLHRKLNDHKRSVVEVELLAAAAAVKEEEIEEEVEEIEEEMEEEEEGSTEESLDASTWSATDSDSEFDESSEESEASAKWSPLQKKGNQKRLTGNKRTASVLADDEVRKKRIRYKTATVRCEPQRICEVIKLLNTHQQEKVKELGFSCLFDFNMDCQGSRRLIMWLMDHLDPDTMVLDLGGTKKLPITEHVVWCVLGLPRGNMDPPWTNHKLNLISVREKLGIPNGKDFEVTYLLRKIQAGGTDRFTMQCFMMVVLAKLLACNYNLYITEYIWGMVQNIDNFGNMNWCKFVVEHLRHSARLWKKCGGKKNSVHGCTALLVMYYLDNLDSTEQMSLVDTPRVKFFGNGMIQKMEVADITSGDDGLPRFGKLNLRKLQRGSCYFDESLESSRHVASSAKAFCVQQKKRNAKLQQQPHTQQIGEQQPQERRDEATNGDTIAAAQEPTSAPEVPAEEHGDRTVPDVHEKQASAGREQGGPAVTGNSKDHDSPTLARAVPGGAEAVQLASTFVNEQMKDFMSGSTEPEILQSSLSKLMRALVASKTQNSELEQQVKELTEKLCNTEDELEAAKATLRGSQAAMLETQSAIAAINSLALRTSATFVKLGDTGSCPPPNMAASSLQEAVKLLEDRVSLIEPVSRKYAESLSRNSVAFGAAALLCREKGVDGLRDAVAGDTRRFLRSQGTEFHSLVGQVVDAVQQQHAHVSAAPSSTR
ncbi:hypothetical protein EJB05_35161 [Eragrostis curvula]|uniref:Uncharacterized protein n=1 Tax=Eragrostis curvula TaxID=38414 RepID=A0A5J9U625_9POAL|nr:hypothetical protein EJB05_35161 [Eragrostis curvula]